MPETYTVKEVADILGYSTNSIYTFLKEKRIRGVRVGKGRFRIPKEEISKIVGVIPEKTDSPLVESSEKVSLGLNKTGISEQKGIKVKEFFSGNLSSNILIPSIFDWFLGISSFLCGLTMLLSSNFVLEIKSLGFENMINPLRIGFVLSAVGFLLADFFGKKYSLWYYLFKIILFFCFFATGSVYLVAGQYDRMSVYFLVDVVMLLSFVFGFGGIAEMTLYLFCLMFVPPLIAAILQEKVELPLFLLKLISERTVFVSAWIVLGLFIGSLLVYGYLYKNRILFITISAISVGLLFFSLWYALNYSFFLALFLLTLSIISLFIPIWNSFCLTCKDDRKVIFNIFGSFLLVFSIMIGVLKIVEINVIDVGRKDLINKLNYASILLDSDIISVRTSLEHLGDNQFFINAIKEKKLDIINNLLKSFFESNEMVRKLSVTNDRGVVQGLYPFDEVLAGRNLSFRPYFKDVVVTKKTVISELFASISSDQHPAQAIAVPVLDNGELIGVLIAGINLDYVGLQLNSLSGDADEETYRVIDNKGNFVIHPQREKILSLIDKKDPFAHAFSEKEGLKETIGDTGKNTLVAYRTLDNIKWAVSLSIPVSGVISIMKNITVIIYAAVILLLIVIIAVNLLIYKNTKRAS